MGAACFEYDAVVELARRRMLASLLSLTRAVIPQMVYYELLVGYSAIGRDPMEVAEALSEYFEIVVPSRKDLVNAARLYSRGRGRVGIREACIVETCLRETGVLVTGMREKYSWAEKLGLRIVAPESLISTGAP